VVGSGYIAVELSGIFQAFGTETYLACRQDRVLTRFDKEVSVKITELYKKNGMNVLSHTQVAKVEVSPNNPD